MYCEVQLNVFISDNIYLCVKRQDIRHIVSYGPNSSFSNLFSDTI
jgi:hypothetical protein